MVKLMNSTQSGPINIGNPGEFTIEELANLVRKKINPKLTGLLEKMKIII